MLSYQFSEFWPTGLLRPSLPIDTKYRDHYFRYDLYPTLSNGGNISSPTQDRAWSQNVLCRLGLGWCDRERSLELAEPVFSHFCNSCQKLLKKISPGEWITSLVKLPTFKALCCNICCLHSTVFLSTKIFCMFIYPGNQMMQISQRHRFYLLRMKIILQLHHKQTVQLKVLECHPTTFPVND